MLRFVFVLASTGSLFAQAWVELEGRYWFSRIHSTIRVENNGLGTDIDTRKDLGFGDTGFPSGRVSVGWGNQTLRFEYTPIDFSGDRTVTRTLVFNGRSYTVGTRVISGLDVQHLQLGWGYQFHAAEGRVKIGPLVEAHGFLLSGRLRAPAVNIDSKEDLSVGIPTIGPALVISPVRQIDVYGEVTGMSVGDYGHFVRSEAGVRVRPVSHLLLTAGYRTFNLSVTNSPDFARLNLRGPFVGGGIRW